MAELCRRYGIGRPTGYKWVNRFEASGLPGLEEHSSRPKSCSHVTAIEITEAILEFRRKHPYWGAKKILRVLGKRHPLVSWPARSTVCDLLSRHGMIETMCPAVHFVGPVLNPGIYARSNGFLDPLHELKGPTTLMPVELYVEVADVALQLPWVAAE